MIKGMGNRLEEVRIYRYAIPFKHPLRVGGSTLEKREGLIVELVDEGGTLGYGEIAPLPGLSQETLEQTVQQVMMLADQLPGLLLPDRLPDIPYYPPVQFGLETAMVNLLRNHFKNAFSGRLSLRPREPIAVNALLHTTALSQAPVDEAVKQLLGQGFKTIKIKVARSPLEQDIDAVNRSAALLPPGTVLRLDANQRWDYEQALAFATGVAGVKDAIEYIEEPFAAEHPGQLETFHRDTGIPVALDESLLKLTPEETALPRGVAAIVLKPTLLGGFGRIMDFIGMARQLRIKPVISSCFEVGPGFIELCRIVMTIDFSHSAAGLDTLGYLQGNLIKAAMPVTGGAISIESLRDNPDIYDLERLERLLP